MNTSEALEGLRISDEKEITFDDEEEEVNLNKTGKVKVKHYRVMSAIIIYKVYYNSCNVCMNLRTLKRCFH